MTKLGNVLQKIHGHNSKTHIYRQYSLYIYNILMYRSIRVHYGAKKKLLRPRWAKNRVLAPKKNTSSIFEHSYV